MPKIQVLENGECLLEKRVPDAFGDLGCVFLLQETFVATLALGGSVECGTFRVSLLNADSSPQPDRPDPFDPVDEVGKSDLSFAETTDGKTVSQLLAGETRPYGDDELTAVSDDPARPTSVSLEVHPRIPGYDLQAMVGRGGMGLVWKAVQLSTNRLVAVKTIHPRMLGNPKSQKRFRREVELAARLTHPNIARIYEAGEVAGQNYFSMELIDGVPWSQHVRSHRLGKSEVLKQLLQVLDAVSYAHTQGVVHRDLKPSNILVDKSGKAYVVDFGLAKYHASEEEELSQQGDVIGTLTFMSPEQASGDVSSTDSRSDVYSLGAVVVYLLGNGLTSEKNRNRDPRDRLSTDRNLQKQAAGILRNDPRLRRILVKALAPEPNQRYEDAGAFASDLREYLEVRMTEVIQASAPQPLRASGWVLATAFAVLLIVGGTTAALMYWPDREPPADLAGNVPAVGSSKPTDIQSERDRAIETKFGDLFHASFQSAGQLPADATATLGIGHKDPAEYPIVHPQGWPLVGFNLATYKYHDRLIVKTVQPIFRDPETLTTETSEMVGRLHPNCEYHQVIAEPGYHVSGIEGVGGKRLHALKVMFRESSAASPRSSRTEGTYESPWYGDPMNDPTQIIGDTGGPAVGLICSYSADIHQIGLVLDQAPTDD
jgi:hypothetical protein